jgi:hypothetical protein
LVFLSLFSFNWSCLSIQSSFLANFCLQQQCMKIVADNNFRYASLTNHFCIYFCMVTMTSHCFINI